MMIKHAVVSSLCLAFLMEISSSQMMLGYPYDLGNYVDYRQDLAGDILSHRQELAQNMIVGLDPLSHFYGNSLYADPLLGLGGGISGPVINFQVDPLRTGSVQQTTGSASRSPSTLTAPSQNNRQQFRVVNQNNIFRQQALV